MIGRGRTMADGRVIRSAFRKTIRSVRYRSLGAKRASGRELGSVCRMDEEEEEEDRSLSIHTTI